jgi:hypothetical protein
MTINDFELDQMARIEAAKIQAEKPANFVVDSFEVLGDGENERLFTTVRDLLAAIIASQTIAEEVVRDLHIHEQMEQGYLGIIEELVNTHPSLDATDRARLEEFVSSRLKP